MISTKFKHHHKNRERHQAANLKGSVGLEQLPTSSLEHQDLSFIAALFCTLPPLLHLRLTTNHHGARRRQISAGCG